jgi:orotate phosphoribosyltransferase
LRGSKAQKTNLTFTVADWNKPLKDPCQCLRRLRIKLDSGAASKFFFNLKKILEDDCVLK